MKARTHNTTTSPARAHVSQVSTSALFAESWTRKSCFPSSSFLQIARRTHHAYKATAGGAALDQIIHSTSIPSPSDESAESTTPLPLLPLDLLKLSSTTSTPLSKTTLCSLIVG